MGFNKRYITKDTIFLTLENGDKLSKLLNADALIMDDWSSKFFKNYNTGIEYKSNRDKLLNDTRWSSFHKTTIEHENYSKLKSLPNILENLYSDPHWVDILITLEILGGQDINPDHRGRFEKLRTDCINKIENHFNG